MLQVTQQPGLSEKFLAANSLLSIGNYSALANSLVAAAMGANDPVYVCDKCPRTFKLEEFFEKHKKVHELKKQHTCSVCGYVYGAAKGLEGHMKTHSDEEIRLGRVINKAAEPQQQPPQPPQPHSVLGLHNLTPYGVLTSPPVTPTATVAPPTTENKTVSSRVEDLLKPTSIGGTGTYEVYGKHLKVSFYPSL